MAGKEKEFDISQHVLVPKHTKLNQKDRDALLEKYRITTKELPKISIKDPAIAALGVELDDIVKIERPSPTAKTTLFYRRVVK
ncbi:MAG: DNA-directed RNA polymerase subunit H [Nanoarchaeota archaeon]|nr:DNA-directed RNA polymerase subunit H [Nanoarchaeota archaeon]